MTKKRDLEFFRPFEIPLFFYSYLANKDIIIYYNAYSGVFL